MCFRSVFHNTPTAAFDREGGNVQWMLNVQSSVYYEISYYLLIKCTLSEEESRFLFNTYDFGEKEEGILQDMSTGGSQEPYSHPHILFF